MNATHVDQTLVQWQQKEETAEAMIPLIGLLYRKNDVITSIYGRQIINQSTIGLLKSHRFVKQVEGHELSVVDTSAILHHALFCINLADKYFVGYKINPKKFCRKIFRNENRY